MEVEGAGFHAAGAQQLGEFAGVAQHGVDFGVSAAVAVFEDVEGLRVAEAPPRADEGVAEVGVRDVAGAVEAHEAEFGEALFALHEGADAVAEPRGEHGQDAVGQIGGVAALGGFEVEGAAGAHVVADVGDVDGEFPAAAVALHGDGVVVVARAGGVDGEDAALPPVVSPDAFVAAYAVGQAGGFVEHGGGEFAAQAVAAHDAEHVDAFVFRPAEDFFDAAGGFVLCKGVAEGLHDDAHAGE